MQKESGVASEQLVVGSMGVAVLIMDCPLTPVLAHQ